MTVVDLKELERMLESPVYRATAWSAHCGCRHEPNTVTLVRCPEHAAGKQYVDVADAS